LTLLQALVLGVVQGATEFLPISSSGHLVLVPWALGWQLDPEAAFVFDVLVQLGTLLSVILFFRADLSRIMVAAIQSLTQGQLLATPDARIAWLLLLASMPAALLGVILKETVAATFARPTAVSGFLLVTAVLLGASELLGKRKKSTGQIGVVDSLVIGVFQSLALFPGISRSGSTIAGGMLRGLTRQEAARFSFLMAVPIMLGAGGIAIIDLLQSPSTYEQIPPLLLGFLSATIVGYVAIRWLIGYLSQNRLTPFVVYCVIVGSIGLIAGAPNG
jgi:undecaprenyl-diphosphatase